MQDGLPKHLHTQTHLWELHQSIMQQMQLLIWRRSIIGSQRKSLTRHPGLYIALIQPMGCYNKFEYIISLNDIDVSVKEL